MPRVIYLDSGPLGLACNLRSDPNKPPFRLRVLLQEAIARRIRVVIPATADYEVRRELIRIGSSASIAELDAIEGGYHPRFPGVAYLPMTDAALKRAARLWAEARTGGYATAGEQALDGDVLVVAQVLDHAGASSRFVIVTGNTKDIARYVGNRRAKEWDGILL